jgi:drug/metabolite transporter (DMT)-like permease
VVGREDEVHFMLPAGWWTTAGLVLSLIGVVLLFRYGMPYRVRTRGQPIRVAISSDPRAATLERRYEMLGWLGLFLVVLGTICQIIGAVLTAT